MTLPENAAFTATPPVPATPIMTARMLPSRSTGESSSFSLMLSALSAGRIQSGIRLGAISAA